MPSRTMLGIYGGRGGEKTTRQTQEKGTQQSWLSSSGQHAETQNWLRAGLHDDYSTDFATDSAVDSSTHSSKNPSKKFFQTVWDRGPATDVSGFFWQACWILRSRGLGIGSAWSRPASQDSFSNKISRKFHEKISHDFSGGRL